MNKLNKQELKMIIEALDNYFTLDGEYASLLYGEKDSLDLSIEEFEKMNEKVNFLYDYLRKRYEDEFKEIREEARENGK